MRFLTIDNIANALGRTKSVGQFLGKSPEDPGYIRHLELRPTDSGVEVWVFDVEDVGNENWLDFYDFPYLQDYGPESPFATLQDAQSAASYAQEKLSADVNRWTNDGVGQDEYLDYIRAGRPTRWPPPA